MNNNIINFEDFRRATTTAITPIITADTEINLDTRTATWENIGESVKDAKNIREALHIAGLDYEVEKTPALRMNAKGMIQQIPQQFVTVDTTSDRTLGIVSDRYEICQNVDAFDFMDSINEIEYVKAGETYNGMVYVIGKLPSINILGDEFRPFVIAQNGHNGKYNVKATICPLRIVCQNQFALAFKESENTVSIRHSSNSLMSGLEDAKNVMMTSANFMSTLAHRAEMLAGQHISDANIQRVVDAMFPINGDMTERIVENAVRARVKFRNAYENNDNGNFRNTVWGMLNAYTDYLTHDSQMRKSEHRADTMFTKVTFDNKKINSFLEIVSSFVA